MTDLDPSHAAKSADTESQNIPLSELLKQETAELHATTEHGSEINRRIVERIDSANTETAENYKELYRLFLIAAHGFEQAVLDRIKEFGKRQNLQTLGYPPEARASAELILDDLRSLRTEETLPELPKLISLPEIETVAEFAGMEYVRRGSRNGNPYIARIVQNNTGCDAQQGASFLNLDFGQVHPHWLQFKTWLDALPLSEADKQQAAATAIATFRAIGEWHRQFKP